MLVLALLLVTLVLALGPASPCPGCCCPCELPDVGPVGLGPPEEPWLWLPPDTEGIWTVFPPVDMGIPYGPGGLRGPKNCPLLMLGPFQLYTCGPFGPMISGGYIGWFIPGNIMGAGYPLYTPGGPGCIPNP